MFMPLVRLIMMRRARMLFWKRKLRRMMVVSRTWKTMILMSPLVMLVYLDRGKKMPKVSLVPADPKVVTDQARVLLYL